MAPHYNRNGLSKGGLVYPIILANPTNERAIQIALLESRF